MKLVLQGRPPSVHCLCAIIARSAHGLRATIAQELHGMSVTTAASVNGLCITGAAGTHGLCATYVATGHGVYATTAKCAGLCATMAATKHGRGTSVAAGLCGTIASVHGVHTQCCNWSWPVRHHSMLQGDGCFCRVAGNLGAVLAAQKRRPIIGVGTQCLFEISMKAISMLLHEVPLHQYVESLAPSGSRPLPTTWALTYTVMTTSWLDGLNPYHMGFHWVALFA